VNDRHAPFDAPDEASGAAHLGGSYAVLGEVREDVDVHGPVDDLLAVHDLPAHLFTAALERAFASSPDEANAELVPHDDGAGAAGSEQSEALSDPDRQGDADEGDAHRHDDFAPGLGVGDSAGGADGGDGLGEPVGHGAGDGDDGW
jgi:hypothetical protein